MFRHNCSKIIVPVPEQLFRNKNNCSEHGKLFRLFWPNNFETIVPTAQLARHVEGSVQQAYKSSFNVSIIHRDIQLRSGGTFSVVVRCVDLHFHGGDVKRT